MLAAGTGASYIWGMETTAPRTLPALHQSDPLPQIRALALRNRRANGPVMRLVNRFGGSVERQMRMLPAPVRDRIEAITHDALTRALAVARHGSRAPDFGPRAVPALAAVTGAAGGLGGLATAIAELPFTVTLILHAILRAAEAEGFDTALPEVQAEALRVLSSGGPLEDDDAVNTTFVGARLSINGAAVQKLLSKVVPKLAGALTQKLAAQTVPVLGAVTGAALNATFLTYYRELAHVRFGLMRLSALHGAEAMRAAFETETEALRVRKI